MLCAEILQQVVELARHFVRTGRTTERALARLAGVSQPHMHNVLKQFRHLSPESADKILQALGLTVPDILWWSAGDPDPGIHSIPILRDRIGPGSHADLNIRRGYVCLPRAAVKSLTSPVAAKLAPDPVLPALFRPNDIVVLDRDPALLQAPQNGWCWIVAEPAGLRVRYLQRGQPGISSSGEPAAGEAHDWKPVRAAGQNPHELIRGRIVWTSRELEAAGPRPPGSSGGRY